MAKEAINNDELISVDGKGDYTIKIFRKEDCNYYAMIVFETDDESKMVYRSRAKKHEHEAKNDAFNWIDKH